MMQKKKPSLEETLIQFMASTAAKFKTIKTQIGQLTNAINSRPQGSLPSNTEPNSRQEGKAQCQAIPCTIGTYFSGRALCDLGASINLMPYSIYRTLGLGEAKSKSITLQLADRSLTYPKGIIEDILVKVDKFIFPADFVVLDMEETLAIGRTLIDIQKGELTTSVQDQQITFNVFKAMKFSNKSDECFFISLFDNLARNESIAKQPLDLLERALLDLIDEENEEDLEVVKTLDASKSFTSRGPSIEEPPTLELKPLPSHLRYAYLGESNTLPVIISSSLSEFKVGNLEKLPPPTSVKGIHSFLGHTGFYRCFIKDFSKISKPLCNFLEKDAPFKFDNACLYVFNDLKGRLISTPIIIVPDWTFPFELMCDASNFAIGAVLGQRRDKIFGLIYYASKTLNNAQLNYTTTEKELLVIVYIDHAAIRYLIEKKDAKPRLIRWVLLLQEFDFEIQDKKGTENQIADHLSRLESPTKTDESNLINDNFSDEQLLAILASYVPWYADIVNYLTCGIIPFDLSTQQKKKFLYCVPEVEMNDILAQCHASPCGGHFQGDRTAAKILQSGFYWPNLFKDAHSFVANCDRCQRTGNISRRHEMPLNTILEVELFDV
ncbi:DNA-directed DNA polymerase [Handroanthus impetiginosus]|uniref:DNA-directed DNA polymerase n=1 Tax=Handroanthus impetiginosus TaxID=429701 RepID=A0A2G9FWP6_9LAMI|nr:DNA-directed DNA polymerase [Handroanthus impetiginosus]